MIDKFGTLFSAFEMSAAGPASLEEEGFSGPWMKVFVEVAKEKVTPPYVQIDGYLELTCPLPDGVDHIRSSLESGIGTSTLQVKIQYIGAPKYRVVVAAPDYKTAEEELKVVTTNIINALQTCGGKASFHREGR